MSDGSPLPKPVAIQRFCGADRVTLESVTDRNGEYVLRGSQFDPVGNWGSRQMGTFGTMKCYLRATLSGYESSSIDVDDIKPGSIQPLPPLVLRRKGSGGGALPVAEEQAPKAARKVWDAGLKALASGAFTEAEKQLRLAAERAPSFAPAWNALGTACEKQQKLDEARAAYQRGAEADSGSVSSLLLLMQLENDAKNWPAARRYAAAVIEKDKQQRHTEAYLHLAVACYQLGELDKAAESAAEAVRLDSRHRIPKAEYVYALILEAQRDYSAAAEHYRRYLDLEPAAGNGEAVRMRIAVMGKPGSAETRPELDVDLNVKAVAPALVPGGMKALAVIAHVEGPLTEHDFFERYCRALIRYMEPSESVGIPGYLESMRAYFAALPELTSLGEQHDGRTIVTLSLSTASHRNQTQRVLSLLGWRLLQVDGSLRVKLSETASDVPKQRIGAALGIDEIAMQQALEAGKSFEFELFSGEAPLMGGDAWMALVHDRQMLQGGLAEAFLRDVRLAKVYTGLSAAGPDAAAAIVSGVGLGRLVERHAGTLAHCGAAFAATPGGRDSDAAWSSLAGASPRNASAFFRSLLEKDGGKLARYYFELSRLDPASVRFYLNSPERAAAYYSSGTVPVELPLDETGQLRYPGDRRAWGEAEETAEPLLALARLEQKRKAPLDAASVELLRLHYKGWQPLFVYLERLPGLGRAEFEALAQFEHSAQERSNPQMGAWYALVELIAQGAEAGSLDAQKSAAAFGRACRELRGTDAPMRAIALLRDLVGNGISLDEGLPAKLIRLEGASRASFDRVLRQQSSMGLEAATKSNDNHAVLTALTAVVYATRLDPAGLLISEDARLSSRHQYTSPNGPLFRGSALERSNHQPGSRLTGGYMDFAGVARRLAFGGEFSSLSAAERKIESATVRAGSGGPAGAAEFVFRSDVRLVEIHATVSDGRGRYVDDLDGREFEVIEDGKPVPVVAFESRLAHLKCALLLDSTLSMRDAIPALKNAALELIAKMRASDPVAVYTFNDVVSLAQGFTTDKTAMKRAVAEVQVRGETALYDAMTRAIRDLSGQQGKKVIVLFTDGDDNASTLNAEIAERRAKSAGIPVYTVAQGMALANRKLLRELESVARATGGLAFAIRDAREIEGVFDAIARDLEHSYLLMIRPGSGAPDKWRRLDVVVRRGKGYRVRSREGYFPD